MPQGKLFLVGALVLVALLAVGVMLVMKRLKDASSTAQQPPPAVNAVKPRPRVPCGSETCDYGSACLNSKCICAAAPSKVRELLSAAHQNNASVANELVLDGIACAVDAKDVGGNTALLHAAQNWNVELFNTLATLNFSVDAVNFENNTPLILACIGSPSHGRAPSQGAPSQGALDMVRIILKSPRGLATLNYENADGRTALDYASEGAVQQVLLAAGAKHGVAGCAPPLELCGSGASATCENTQTSLRYCGSGAARTACKSGYVCTSGSCVCSGGNASRLAMQAAVAEESVLKLRAAVVLGGACTAPADTEAAFRSAVGVRLNTSLGEELLPHVSVNAAEAGTGYTALMMACMHPFGVAEFEAKRLAAVQYLLAKGADASLKSTDKGLSAIMMAVDAGVTSGVIDALIANFPSDHLDKAGKNPLDHATTAELRTILLKKGFKCKQQQSDTNIVACGPLKACVNPLVDAAHCGSCDNSCGQYACTNGQCACADIVDALWTAVQTAVQNTSPTASQTHHKTAISTILNQSGVCARIGLGWGNTSHPRTMYPLLQACKDDRLGDVLAILLHRVSTAAMNSKDPVALANVANINGRAVFPSGGKTTSPLLIAAESGNSVAVHLLLREEGVNANIQDDSTNTPLFLAVLKGHVDTARLLLESPKVLKTHLVHGKSILELLPENVSPGMMELLNAANADIPCGQYTTKCGRQCVQLVNDAQHCKSCNNACKPGAQCVTSTCRCPSSTIDCPDKCADVNSDAQNCAACGKACLPGQTCSARQCQCSGSLDALLGLNNAIIQKSEAGVRAGIARGGACYVPTGQDSDPEMPLCVAIEHYDSAIFNLVSMAVPEPNWWLGRNNVNPAKKAVMQSTAHAFIALSQVVVQRNLPHTVYTNGQTKDGKYTLQCAISTGCAECVRRILVETPIGNTTLISSHQPIFWAIDRNDALIMDHVMRAIHAKDPNFFVKNFNNVIAEYAYEGNIRTFKKYAEDTRASTQIKGKLQDAADNGIAMCLLDPNRSCTYTSSY
jgi:ankyrin repeat protein